MRKELDLETQAIISAGCRPDTRRVANNRVWQHTELADDPNAYADQYSHANPRPYVDGDTCTDPYTNADPHT